MSLFGDAWENLDTPDITCTNEASLSLNHWRVSLGIMIVFILLAIITLIMFIKNIQKDKSDDGLEKRNGRDDLADIKACEEQSRNFLRAQLGVMAQTCRKNPFIHYYATCLAMTWFSLLLALFQRFPQNEYAPMVFIIFSSIFWGCVFYYTMTAKAPTANVDVFKEYWMYSPRNVYQDLSASFIHPLFIFCIQSLLTIIYVWGVFDENFPPCINTTAAFTLFAFAGILKSLYYGVEFFHNMRNIRDDRKLWTETYEMLFPDQEVTQYKLAWASSPPMEGELSKWQWYVRSILDVLANWVIWTILYFFMVIQSANGEFQDFVLSFVAAEFILHLDDYATFGYEGCFCIVKCGKDPPFKLPTTAMEDVELQFIEKNKKMKLHFAVKNEEMKLHFTEKNEEMALHFRKKNEEMNLRFEEMELRFKEKNED